MSQRPSDPSGTAGLTPDEIEQRQAADGTVEDEAALDDVPDHPLSADELEQRQVVEEDEDERRDG